MADLCPVQNDHFGGRNSTYNELDHEILRYVLESRRSLPADPCVERPCWKCHAPHLEQIRFFTAQGQPIHFVLPAFPAKSPNPRNVLGSLPDMAERLALRCLQRLCEQVRGVYPPGARITIYADGRVFTDLVRLRDEDVTVYTQEVRALIDELGAGDIDVFDLDEAFDTRDFDELRRRLLLHHALPLGEIRGRVKAEPASLHAYNGVSRFLFEDRVVLEPEKSRTAVRTACKDLAYRVMQRSLAWGRLIKERSPRSIRLSVHPQPCHSEKIGIYLIETRDNWLTPWHGVAVEVGGRFMLMKRHQAEGLGAALVHQDGRPSHFVLPDTVCAETRPCCAEAA
jgi:pyoverdine/dityrosine biosynthesis protein Dit1